MSNSDSPAGSAGGPVTVPVLDDLPDKLRVHALAKLLGRTSREVLATLSGLGVEGRSAQSSIERKIAEQVVSALLPRAPAPETGTPAVGPPDPTPATPEPDTAEPGTRRSATAQAETSTPARTRRRATREPVTEEPSGARRPVSPEADGPAPAPTRGEPEPAVPPTSAGVGLAPLFAPPTPLFQPPTRPARTRRRAATPEPDAGEHAPDDTAARRTGDPDRSDESAVTEDTADDTAVVESDDTDESDDGAARRRRRRGRRGRGRGRGGDGFEEDGAEDGTESGDDKADWRPEAETEADEASNDDESDEADADLDQGDGESGGSRRRRRRRRRGASDDPADVVEEDPPGTVTRVRSPREQRAEDEGDGVQSVRGSTRLEAKRQRRRDGRDAGRRRVPILSEAEFLARRESVDRSMVVRERGDRIEIGVLEDDILVEHFVAGRDAESMVGNIYLGRVQNVLPSMEAAFVDIGRGRNAVLYAGEVDWDAAGLGGKARRIEQALSSGDSVLVQVSKEPIGHKGARLTTQLSLAGRFLVYVPSGGAAGISRKLPDVERRRLKDMLKEIVPGEAGVIIRTASEGVSHEALERDVRRLQAQWDVVKTKAEQTGPHKPKAPVLLYEEPDLLIKVVRDQFNEDFSRLVVQGDDAWDTLSNYVGHVAPELADRLHRHVGPGDVFAEYRIDEQLLKALDRKVWLPSGGTLVIDRTEAMTVIDVNTGKFTGSGGNLEETVTRNNLEAAEEVVRQLRLRDVGGIIVVDFIDMVLEANRDLVLRRLTECLARDRTRHQVAEVTSLGLVQMTRKRVGGGLLEHFSAPCEHCRGRGVVITTEPVVEKGDAGRGPDRRSRGGRGGRRGEDELERGVPVGNGHDVRRDEPGRSQPEVGPDTRTETVGAESGAAVGVGSAAAETSSGPPAAAPDVVVPSVEDPAAGRSAAERIRTDVVAESPLLDAAPAENGRPARRRGRVTRTAGAPASTDGDAPVTAVVTVPAMRSELVTGTSTGPGAVPAAVVPQPASAAARSRRTRRAASRPAGPPVVEDVAGSQASVDSAGAPV